MEQGRISSRQLAVLIIYFIIGDMLLILPSLTISAAKQDGWLAGWVGFLIGWPIAWLLFRFSRLIPGLTLIQYNRRLLGKWVGGIVTLFYLYYYLVTTGVLVREVGDFFSTQIFPEMPINAIHFMLIITLVWGIKCGLESIARSGETFFPLYIFLFLALFLLLIPQAELVRLRPVMGEGVRAILHGSLYSTTFTFCELNTVLMILPYVVNNNKTERDFLLGTFIGGMAICSIILLTILVIGPNLASSHLYAAYAAAQKINIGSFLQRVEAILAINWILSTFFKTIVDFYAFLLGTAQFLNLRDHRQLAVPGGMLVFGAAFAVSANVVYFNYIVEYYIFWDLTCAVAIPLLLYIVYKFRSNSSALGSA
ncbi:endospore germination permease [Paenibacillus hodogayensis]|uniref:Endospore germination permease n=1 Tax=Paenibacillus hodogayensis TaxID=279208 RepID=A0ABV5VY58_9BACL